MNRSEIIEKRQMPVRTRPLTEYTRRFLEGNLITLLLFVPIIYRVITEFAEVHTDIARSISKSIYSLLP